MSGGRRDRKSKGVVGDDAVEELLREAEDDLLLKLSVNTHTTSSSALDPDLARRFEALKSPPRPPARALHPAPSPSQPPPRSGGAHPPPPARALHPAPSPSQPPPRSGGAQDEEMSRVLGDDLAARFAALKGPSAASSEPQSAGPVLRSDKNDDEDEDEDEDGVGVSKKEVEKVMQWAMDAARLDPSKSDDDNDEDNDEVDKEEENLELKQKAREEGIKGKEKSKKWFFF